MNVTPGHCVVTNKQLVRNGKPSAHYEEVELLLDDGSVTCVAVAKGVELPVGMYPEIIKVLNKTGSKAKKVIEESGRKDALTLIKEFALEKCMKCGDVVGEQWKVSDGQLICKGC
jgi:hypothetical protein